MSKPPTEHLSPIRETEFLENGLPTPLQLQRLDFALLDRPTMPEDRELCAFDTGGGAGRFRRQAESASLWSGRGRRSLRRSSRPSAGLGR